MMASANHHAGPFFKARQLDRDGAAEPYKRIMQHRWAARGLDPAVLDPSFDSHVAIAAQARTDLPPRWPTALQILELDWCLDLQRRPPLPSGLRFLVVRHCRLTELPDLSACEGLQEAELEDNLIDELDALRLPAGLRRLGVARNKLREVRWLELMGAAPALRVVDIRHNKLKHDAPATVHTRGVAVFSVGNDFEKHESCVRDCPEAAEDEEMRRQRMARDPRDPDRREFV